MGAFGLPFCYKLNMSNLGEYSSSRDLNTFLSYRLTHSIPCLRAISTATLVPPDTLPHLFSGAQYNTLSTGSVHSRPNTCIEFRANKVCTIFEHSSQYDVTSLALMMLLILASFDNSDHTTTPVPGTWPQKPE